MYMIFIAISRMTIAHHMIFWTLYDRIMVVFVYKYEYHIHMLLVYNAQYMYMIFIAILRMTVLYDLFMVVSVSKPKEPSIFNVFA